MRALLFHLIKGQNYAVVCYVGNRMRSFRDRFLRSKQSQVFRFDVCCSFAFCELRSRTRSIALAQAACGPNNQSAGYARLCAQPDSRIQHRKGWIRSSRTAAIQSKRACFCFRMRVAGEKPGLLDEVLPARSLRPSLISLVRAHRREPRTLPYRVATTAPRAWPLGSPCARAPASRILRA